MAQTDVLLQALKAGEHLTVLSALQKYQVYALSQRMGELRRAGYPIGSAMITVPSGKRVAQYFWAGQLELAA